MAKIVGGLTGILLLLPAATALAQVKGNDVSAVGVVFDFMLLFTGILCFVMCLKIFSLLRGGELSPGWQMLSVSFLIFSIAQILSLSIELEFVALHKNAISVLQVVSLLLIALGVGKIKKSLT